MFGGLSRGVDVDSSSPPSLLARCSFSHSRKESVPSSDTMSVLITLRESAITVQIRVKIVQITVQVRTK